MRTYICHNTNNSFESENPFTYEGNVYCPDSVTELFFKCTHCDEWHSKEDEIYTGICRDCSDNYYTCDRCSYLHLKDDLTMTVNNRLVCDDCLNNFYTQCSNCNDWIPNSSICNHNDNSYCSDCFNEVAISCNNCGQWIDRDNAMYDDDDDEHYCSSCYDNNHREQTINAYNYKPEPEFYGKGPVYFGHEIEVVAKDDKNDSAESILSLFGDIVYCKEDGSLPDEGFEIVTHPMSYDYVIDNKVFDKFIGIDYIRSFKHSECGHHIHVSKTAFKSELHLAKTIVFFAQNEYFIEFIAQRPHNNYCACEKKQWAARKAHGKQEFKRYSAINLQNSNTVEFRVFKGNIAPDRIIKNLQFVKAIIEFCSETSLQDLFDKNFIEYLKATKYKILKDFCKDYKKNSDL